LLLIHPGSQIYPHLRAIFVHVPKTAGTSIELTLRRSRRDVYGGHTSALGFKALYPDQFATYFKFAFVRDPVDRFVSAYCYLAQCPVDDALGNQVIHQSGSLSVFLRRVASDPSILGGITHLMPQHEFVCDGNGNVLVDAVYRFENLPQAWREIRRRLGLWWVGLPRLNSSRRVDDIVRQMDLVSSVVRDLYAMDFALFYPDQR
jgi:hypothetical protein